jgi:hypothetical protein
MFRRMKRQGDEPLANELSGSAEPNTLKLTKPGKEGESEATEWAWTADGMTPIESDDAEFDDDDELEKPKGAEPTMTPEELQAELQRQAEEFGLTGDNPIGLYGPHGEDVAGLLNSLPEIDDETAEAIADAYEAIPEAERKVAQSVVRRRHRGGKWAYELDIAERGVTDWLSSLKIFDPNDAEMYAVVASAATDAVDALILEDELADADFDTLYGAWSEVMDLEDDETALEDGTTAPEAAAEAAASPNAETKGKSDDHPEDAAENEGPFGPNTELVIQFLDKLTSLDGAQIVELVSGWRDQPKDELRVAHRALQALADEDHAWREQLRLAQEEVFAWMESRTTTYLEHFATTKEDARARESAGPVVADAVAALVMADVLEDEDAEILYAPWAELIGEPALPTYEDKESDE